MKNPSLLGTESNVREPKPGSASRRTLLMCAATLLAGGSVCSRAEEAGTATFLQRRDVKLTSAVGPGRKFNADGEAQRFGGNSFICHLPPNGPFRKTITDVRNHLIRAPISSLFSILPTSSHHMTIIEGVTDTQGRKEGWWPADLPLDTPLTIVHQHFLKKLRSFSSQSDKRFKMRTAGLKPFGDAKGLTLLMEPADAETANNLRHIRRSVSELLQINQPAFETYKHHITLGYSIVTPDADEAGIADLLQHECELILSRGPSEVDLGPVEYVVFDDMLSFSPLLYLGEAG